MSWPCMTTELLSLADPTGINNDLVNFLFTDMKVKSINLSLIPGDVGISCEHAKTVLSENSNTPLSGWELTQSFVYEMSKNSELTPPWGAPVLYTAISDSAELNYTGCGLFDKKCSEWKGLTSNWTNFLSKMCGWIILKSELKSIIKKKKTVWNIQKDFLSAFKHVAV